MRALPGWGLRRPLRWGDRRRFWWAAVLAAVVLVSCDFQVGTRTGELDPGFGDGAGFVSFAGRARSDEDADLAARQPDGKVVFLVHQGATELLVRYLPDGSLDPSFGDGGVATIELPTSIVRQVAIAPDGDIVLVGAIFGSGATVWLIARYEPDGDPDASFGTNGIAQLEDLEPAVPVGGVHGVASVGDELVILTFRSGVDPFDDGLVVKLGPDAAVDTTFGPNGDGTVRVGDAADTGVIAGLPDGSFAVTTEQGTATGLRQVGPTGTLGAAIDLSTASTRPFRFEASAVDHDGSFYVAGPEASGQPDRHVLVRVTPGFTLDPNFGDGGVAALAGPFFGLSMPTGLAITEAGVLVTTRALTLEAGEQVLSARVGADGTLDPTYGDGGIVVYPEDARAVGIFASPSGDQALIVGSTSPEGQQPGDLLQLRLDGVGAPDPSFGTDGRVLTDFGRPGNDEFTVAEQLPGGAILVAGDTGDGVIAGRYGGDGTPDADHPPAPLLPDRFVGPHAVRDVVVADDGSAYLLVEEGDAVPEFFEGGGGTGWHVVKLDPDGGLDTAFGDDGVVSRGDAWRFPNGIALQSDGTILVAHTLIHPAQPIPPHGVEPASFEYTIDALTPAGLPDTTFGGVDNDGSITVPAALGVGFGPPFTGLIDTNDDGFAFIAATGRLLRLDPDGTTFTLPTLPTGVAIDVRDVAVDGDTILATGSGTPGGSVPATEVVGRFVTTGSEFLLDPGFGTGGIAPLPIVARGLQLVGPLLMVGDDGKITVARQQRTSGRTYDDMVISRIHGDGTADTTFSGDGVAQAPLRPAGVDATTAEATLLGEDIILVGTRNADTFTTRING